MLKFETNGKNGSFEINLPTSLKEITPEYLNDVTAGISIADNYSLIAICHRETLSSIIFAATSKKKNLTTAVIPVFIKSGKTDNDFISNIKTGEKLIVAPSDIALGHHVTSPDNRITIDYILYCVEGDKDIYQDSLKHNGEYCYFVEFKLIPNCNINGCYKDDIGLTNGNPFVQRIDKGA